VLLVPRIASANAPAKIMVATENVAAIPVAPPVRMLKLAMLFMERSLVLSVTPLARAIAPVMMPRLAS